jgi:uncharacterized protein involved in response to NO
MSSFVILEEPRPRAQRPRPPGGFALWALGFRPFYLLGTAFAAVSVLLWALQLAGALPRPYLEGALWHAHEMLFGFALAIIVGFLFTAGHNWTGRPTPTGRTLMALAALWLAGRVLVLTPWAWPAALANVAFPLACALALARPLVQAGNRRNFFFVGLLLLMAAAAAAVHAGPLGLATLPPWAGLALGLDVVLFVVVVMAGRVVPMFTNNGVPGAAARRVPALERAALGSVLALLLCGPLGIGGWPLALLAAAAAVLHAARWWLWQPWRTLRVPLLWVLHLAYAWVPLHLALRSAAALGALPASLAVHALTVGAVGGLIIGMVTRTARGHTGLALRADAADVACYVLVALAALVRVALPWALPALTLQALLLSSSLWSAGFALYAVRYAPRLLRPRPDGRPG